MATSSIIENIRVKNPRALEEYVKALEELEKAPFRPRTESERSGVIDDKERIRQFVEKNLEKNGIPS